MLDIKWIASNPEEFNRGLEKRGINYDAAEIISLDNERRRITTLVQQLQHSRKEKARIMSAIKDKNSEEFKLARRDAEHVNEKLVEIMKQAGDADHLHGILDGLPNIPDASVPEGRDENDNQLVRTYGDPQQIPCAKQHFELGEGLGMMEFEQTVKMSGSRFVTLTGDLAKLERALASFMLDVQTKEFGFYEVSPPYLVRPVAMYNVGQLPKFEEESFVTTTDYRLIPTSEVSLVNMVMDKIIQREKLPIRYVAHTPCFRSEAGSAGKDTRGMFRVHQFSKVELVTISTPEESEKEHEHIVNAAESILKKLELPYRVMLLCAGDMGFHSKKTYDLEVWLPGQKRYREISSCSNCGDYQARRLKARYKEFGATETTLVHTLNGSGLAVGRTIIAILENYQNADGSITVPKALQSYMGGMSGLRSSNGVHGLRRRYKMQKITPLHPGEVLKTEFLDAFNITAYKLAKDIHVPVNRITEIINGQRNIGTETALMLSKYFGLSSGFWIRMQSYYDEVVTKDKINNLLSAIHPISTLSHSVT